MNLPILSSRLTVGFIVLQLAVLIWSLTTNMGTAYSMFCAVGDDGLGDAFSSLHFIFLLLLPLGLASLRYARLRIVYAVVLFASLAALTQQQSLLNDGHLHCDVP